MGNGKLLNICFLLRWGDEIAAWININSKMENKYIYLKVRDELTCPSPNSNGEAVGVR